MHDFVIFIFLTPLPHPRGEQQGRKTHLSTKKVGGGNTRVLSPQQIPTVEEAMRAVSGAGGGAAAATTGDVSPIHGSVQMAGMGLGLGVPSATLAELTPDAPDPSTCQLSVITTEAAERLAQALKV